MRIIEQIDGFLWRHGFIDSSIRCIQRNIFLVSFFLLLAGCVFLPYTNEPMWIALASLLTCWNFYGIAKIVQKTLPAKMPTGDVRGSATAAIVKKRVLFFSHLRLFLTAVFVYITLVVFHAGAFSLVAGFSVSVFVIPISLLLKH